MSSTSVVAASSEYAALYEALSWRLERIVRSGVCAGTPVIEDACQCAWSRLLGRPVAEMDGGRLLGWLARTATHEAMRLQHRDDRELSLEAMATVDDEADVALAGACDPHEVAEQRERLSDLAGLPERQRQFLWLQGLGYSYEEIARCTGASSRTVERQVLRARRRIRALTG